KIWEFSIHISPLGPIRRVSQHLILLTLFFVPPHQFSIGFISEKALQTWYYWEIPHHLSGNFFLDGLPVDLTRIILPDLVRFASQTGQASSFSYSSPRYRIQSLGHA